MQPRNPSLRSVVGHSSLVVLFGAALLSMSACANQPQGPTAAVQPSGTSSPIAREIEPAPVSKSYPPKKEVFQGAQYDPGGGVASAYPNARQITLRVGEVQEVFHGSWAPNDGQVQLAFYLPPEAASVVQLVVETKGFAKTYFLRGLSAGETVGGVVERRWLDAGGYRAYDTASEARIQNAVRSQPYLIFVQ